MNQQSTRPANAAPAPPSEPTDQRDLSRAIKRGGRQAMRRRVVRALVVSVAVIVALLCGDRAASRADAGRLVLRDHP